MDINAGLSFGPEDLFFDPLNPQAMRASALRGRPIGPARTASTSVPPRPSAMPAARTVRPPQTDQYAPPPREPKEPDERERINAEIERLNAPADYTSQISEARRRSQNSGGQLLLAMAAQQAGEQYAPMSGQFLKKAMEMRDPLKVEGGFINEQGDVVLDPAFQREKQLSRLQARLKAIDDLDMRKATLAQQEQLARERMQLQAQMAAMTNSIAQGNLALRREMEDGRRAEREARAAAQPKLPAHIERELLSNTQSTAAIQGALKAVQAAPDAFGAMVGAPNLVPGAVGTVLQTGRDRTLTPEQIAARGMVFNNVSKIINERAGAAQSVQEIQRLRGFLPSDTDGPREVKAKLEGFLDYLHEQDTAIRSMVPGGAPGRGGASGGWAPPGAPAAAPAPAQQRAQSYYN